MMRRHLLLGALLGTMTCFTASAQTHRAGDIPNAPLRSHGQVPVARSVSRVATDGVPRRFLLEENTGAWCGYCIEGVVRIHELLDAYPEAIVVAIHDDDQMQVAEGDSIVRSYTTSYPEGLLDRLKWPGHATVTIGRDYWQFLGGNRRDEPSPVSVGIDHHYAPATRMLTANISATFNDIPDAADLRINLYLVEDSVSGSGTGWDQANALDNVPESPYYGKGGYIPSFVHDHVLRAVLSGTWGTAGVIPSSPETGKAYTKSYSFALPASFNPDHVSLVAFMASHDADAESREVFNAEKVPLLTAPSGVDDKAVADFSAVIAPSPVRNAGTLSLSLPAAGNVGIALYDQLGRNIRAIFNGPMEQGAHTIGFDLAGLANGVYWMAIDRDGARTARRVIIQR
ncbi:MAG: outer membrane protein Omp28 [Chlorobi bacterium]|nr:outer membrane protein Omp28 [Chlorobiota bacterium]